MSAFTVTEAAMRPASEQRVCFYCREAVGATHKPSCVLIVRRVRLRVSIEYEVTEPADWTPGQVVSHRNESSWCNDNLIAELETIAEKAGCLCCSGSGVFTSWTFVEDTTAPYLREKA